MRWDAGRSYGAHIGLSPSALRADGERTVARLLRVVKVPSFCLISNQLKKQMRETIQLGTQIGMSRFADLMKDCRACGSLLENECVTCGFCEAEHRAEQKLLNDVMRAGRRRVESKCQRKRARKVKREQHHDISCSCGSCVLGRYAVRSLVFGWVK